MKPFVDASAEFGTPPSHLSDTEIHAAVERIVLELGLYTPVELLLALGVLDYASYRAWRLGGQAALDEAVAGDARTLRRVLIPAAAWARARGFECETLRYAPWEGHTGHVLLTSRDREIDALLCAAWRPAEDGAQLDLFTHSSEQVAVVELRESFLARDLARARAACRRLEDVAPSHPLLPVGRCLTEVLESRSARDRAEAREELERLHNEWLPAAERLLDARCRDLLAPRWQHLGHLLEGEPFDPAAPHRHASASFRQCLDWQGVRRCVLAADYRREGVLLGRLAEAERRLGNRNAALALWCVLCWTEPHLMAGLIDAPDFPDAPMAGYWRELLGEDVETPEVRWLPAWMLLREPGLAHALPRAPGPGAPERAYDALRSLIRIERGGAELGADVIAARARLKAASAWLLNRFLAREG